MDDLRWLASACVCCVKISRNKRKRQPTGMLGRSIDNHDWLLANASACVSCGFRLRDARNARNASDCVWMETALWLLPYVMHAALVTVKGKRFINDHHELGASLVCARARAREVQRQINHGVMRRLIWLPTARRYIIARVVDYRRQRAPPGINNSLGRHLRFRLFGRKCRHLSKNVQQYSRSLTWSPWSRLYRCITSTAGLSRQINSEVRYHVNSYVWRTTCKVILVIKLPWECAIKYLNINVLSCDCKEVNSN